MPQSAPAIAQAPSVPRTAAELNALRARRAELREQLESTTDWRGRLVQERHNADATNNVAVVRELDGRIKELGERSTRMERALVQTDDAIAQALANGVTGGSGSAVTVTVPPMPAIPTIPPIRQINLGGGFSGRDVSVFLFGEALAFVLLGVVMWRMAFRRGARSVQVSPGRDATQLQQSLDAIAVEVERISENQRFVTKMLNEKGDKSPAGQTGR